MNIAVLTGYDDTMREIGDLTSARLLGYCSARGYDCLVYRNAAFDHARPAVWSKVRMIQAAIRSGVYDWVFWIDADALVLHRKQSVEHALQDGKRLLATRDSNGLNAGVMLLRADEAMLSFMEVLYAQTEFINHTWREQAALVHLFNQNYAGMQDWVGFIEKAVWNSYPSQDTDEHSFIVHVPGVPFPERLRILRKHEFAAAISKT